MHEHQGFFCKTVNPRIITKIAGGKKTRTGPNLTGPTVQQVWVAAHIGLSGRKRRGGWAFQELGAAGEVNARGHAVILLLEAEDAGGDDHGRA